MSSGESMRKVSSQRAFYPTIVSKQKDKKEKNLLKLGHFANEGEKKKSGK